MPAKLKAEKLIQPKARKPERVENIAMRTGGVAAVQKAVLSGFPREPMTGKKLAKQLSAKRQEGGPYPSDGEEMTTKFFGLKKIEWKAEPDDVSQDSTAANQELNWIDPDMYAYYEETGAFPDFQDGYKQEVETAFRHFFAEEWPKPEYDFLRPGWADLVHNEDPLIRVMGKSALWNAVQLHTTQETIEEMRQNQQNGQA